MTTTVGSEARGIPRSDIHNVRASSDLLTAETLSSWCYVLKRTFSPAGTAIRPCTQRRIDDSSPERLPNPDRAVSTGLVTPSGVDRPTTDDRNLQRS